VPVLLDAVSRNDKATPSTNVKVRRRLVFRHSVAALAVLALAAGCQSDTPSSSAASPTPTASSSPTPSVDPSVVSAIDAYLGYVAAYAHAANTANVDDPALAQYIGGGLLLLSQHNLRVLADHGAVELGAPTATVQTTSARCRTSRRP